MSYVCLVAFERGFFFWVCLRCFFDSMKHALIIFLKVHAFMAWIGFFGIRRMLLVFACGFLLSFASFSLHASNDSSDEYALSCLKEGITRLKEWYVRRARLVRPDGTSYLTPNELRIVSDRLDSVSVLLSRYPYLTLYEGLKEGRFHLHRHLQANHPLSVCSDRELKRMSEHYFALTSLDIVEPVIIVNVSALWEANRHWASNPHGLVYGSLQQVAVHEATHAATSGQRQDLVVQSLLSGLTVTLSDPYLDQPNEIYARVNELRYSLGVDPSHMFTLEEVKALRKRAKADLKAYKGELRAIGLRNIKHFSELPFEGKLIDPTLFLRYSDEEILGFLNWTA